MKRLWNRRRTLRSIVIDAKQTIRAYKKFVADFPDYDVDVKLCAFTASEMAKAKAEFDYCR